MDDIHATYHSGDQDISEQTLTYQRFGSLAKWGSLFTATLLVMLVIWFCIGAGFLGGLIPGLILLGVGIAFLRSTPARKHGA